MVPTRHYSGRNKERSEEATRVFYGVETVVNTVLEFVNETNIKIDACVDQTRPSLVIGIAVLKEAFIDAKKRGVDLRYITEITKDNISYCKELMSMVGELRHLDGIKGNMYLSETEYLAPATFHERGKPAAQIIYSNVKEIVEHQRYVFDTLWARAIPAQERIEQIEGGGVEHEFVQLITNTNKARDIFSELVKSAKEEVLLFLANDKALVRIDRLGLVDHMIKLSQQADATIKVISPLSQENSEIVNRINKMAPSIRILNSDNNSPFSLCIIDGEKLLRAEIKQLAADDFSGAVDFAIYSNRNLTVNSFKSIFELLWNERILNEQLKVHDKMQSEFINIASHEIKTPTQAILGYTELLQRYPEKGQGMIQVIYRHAKRLQRLTNDILDVTRIESHTLKLNKEKFNLAELISNVVEDFRTDIQNKATAMKLLLAYEPNDLLVIEADKGRISQVISNLLNNAIKFTKEGNISISITKKADEHGKNNNQKEQEVIISIKDTGAGIDPEILPRLFTKFATKSFEGTGLGLFICKSIIEAHNGRIWAQNNSNGSGATFAFSLPLVKQF